MPTTNIQSYHAAWSASEKRGLITVNLTQGRKVLRNLSYGEFLAITDLLRNERPLYWQDNGNWIYSGPEPPGESER